MLNYFPNSVYSVQSKVIVCVSSVLLKCDCLHQFTVQSKVIVSVISVWCLTVHLLCRREGVLEVCAHLRMEWERERIFAHK